VTKDIPADVVAYGSPAIVAGVRSDLGDVDRRVRDRAAKAPSLLCREDEAAPKP
jgi:hypothetical protein